MIFIFIVSTMSHQLRSFYFEISVITWLVKSKDDFFLNGIFLFYLIKGIIILSFKLHSYYIKEAHNQLLLDTARRSVYPSEKVF